MQTVSFHCPHCKNLMGVGIELLGQQVQCPSCHGVVVAPTTAEPMVSFDDSGKVESHESIFGEVHDEDLFGSRPPKVEMPPESESITAPVQPVLTDSQSQFAAYPPGVPPPAEVEPPLVTAEPMMAPAHWPTVAVETPEPDPPDMEAGSETLAWVPSARDAAEIDARRLAPTLERRKGANLALAIVAPYAVVATVAAIYYFLLYTNRPASDHPMANIPDIFAEYEPARRGQLARRIEKMPPVDAPLPDSLLVRLGETLRIGDLEVTPEKVEQKRITLHTVFHDNEETNIQPDNESLVLHLKLRNRSSGVLFHPTDPVFDRMYDSRSGSAKPYTQLIANGYHSYGGPIDWLSIKKRNLARRKFVEGQENDDKQLPPGEERHTVIATDPGDVRAIEAVKNHKGPESIVWRVQLRRGLTTFRDRELSTCAVVGVQFSPSDVK